MRAAAPQQGKRGALSTSSTLLLRETFDLPFVRNLPSAMSAAFAVWTVPDNASLSTARSIWSTAAFAVTTDQSPRA